MFVDASAVVAIMTLEPGHESLAADLELASRSITSPLAIYEAALAIARLHRRDVGDAKAKVVSFLQRAEIAVVPIDGDAASLALDAQARYGKGSHPARLNMGDCFAYAVAKQHGVPLLYKGNDFSQTDLA
jgi:ribonuclease VapC